MKPLPLLLGLAAAAGLATSAALYVNTTHTRKAHAAELAQAHTRAAALESRATELTTQNTALQAQVAELDASLGDAKTKLTVTEARNVQLAREVAATKTELLASASRLEAFQREITDLQRDLSSARASSASTENIAAYQATIADLERQLAQARIATTSTNVAATATSAPTPNAVLTTHRSRNATVASVGPSSAFVVLNYGATHGALPAQQLLIQRGTDVLARVLISDVRANYSIAQVRPDSLRGALHKGDLAVLTE